MSLINSASLIVTPNGYKEGKLYSVIPSDGSGDMSVVRATTATRVNSAGLVELVPYNLLQYSEQLDNATSWGFGDVVLSSNQTIAPDGTTTADKVTINTVNTEHVVYNITNYANEVGNWTTSVYLKKGNSDYVQLANNGAISANYAYIIVNLNNGAVTQSGNSGSYTLNSYAVTSVGNGWYRCSINYNNTSDEARGIRIRFSNSATPTISVYGSIIFTGNGTDFFYAWGAQFNSGSLKPYQKTETRLNIPRLDYSNGTCPSLLVEPQRTNLARWSSSFDNAAWTKLRATITANNTTAPDGTSTADKIVATTVNGDHSAFQSTTNGVAKSLSVYAKAGEYNYVFVGDNNDDNQGAFFNLSNGTISQNTSAYTAKIEDAGNGWYRCSVSASNWVNTPALVGISPNGTTLYFTGDGTSGIYIWGAQIENATYPTSYIPTTSASVTRNADSVSKTGISSLIGQTEGTMFVEINNAANTGTLDRVLAISDGTGANRIFIIKNATGNIYFYVASGGSAIINQTNISGTSIVNGNFKIAAAYKSGEYALYLNGVLVFTSTASGVPATNGLYIATNEEGGVSAFSGGIKAAALWKTRLTNDELERLTGTGFNTYAEMANYYNYITQ